MNLSSAHLQEYFTLCESASDVPLNDFSYAPAVVADGIQPAIHYDFTVAPAAIGDRAR